MIVVKGRKNLDTTAAQAGIYEKTNTNAKMLVRREICFPTRL